jgi:hypothetical protein
MWHWAESMKPGTIVIWRASNLCVLLPMSGLISELLPTAANRPALTANASAFGAWESTV